MCFFKKNPSICLVAVSGMVTGAALNFIDEYWQLYLNRLSIPVVYFGMFSAGFMLLRLPGNILAHTLKRVFHSRNLLLGITGVFAAGFLCLSILQGYIGLAAIFLICLCSGVMEPIIIGYLHHRITDSSMRATIDSFQSLGENVVLSITGIGFGFFSTRFDIFGGYGFIAFICCVFFVYFSIVFKKIKES